MAASAQVLQFPTSRDPEEAAPEVERDPLMLEISKLKKQLEGYRSAKTAENDEAQEADAYYHCDQFTKDQLTTYRGRNQPVVTYNRENRKINTVVGILEKARQDPKAYPNKPTPGAEDGAEIATKVIRNLIGWDWQLRTVQIATRGAIRAIAGCELVLSENPKDPANPKIELDDVDQRDFFYDPRSQKLDFADARFLGTERWVDLDEALDMFPDSEEDLTRFTENYAGSWDKADTRNKTDWYNKSEKQVRIVDHWYKRGKKWFQCVYVSDVVLYEGESPFRDIEGNSDHKFCMMSCNVDHDGDRYGFHRNLKGPQDEINSRRSKALHLLNMRQIRGEKGAFDDIDAVRREAARPDGVILWNKGYEAEIFTNDKDAAGNLEMLVEAKNEIDNYGPNPALIGTTVDAASGKAIALLQAAGIAEIGSYVIAHKHWKLSVYRKLWCAAQVFWTGEKFVRETDQDGMAQFIQVQGWQKDEFGVPTLFRNLAEMDVDIVLDEGDDTVTAMEDTFDTIVDMAGKGVQVPPDVIIELSRLPSSVKKKVMAMMAASGQPNPMDLQAMQVKLEQEIAKVQQIQADAILKGAQAAKVQMEAQIGPEGAPAQIDTSADLAKARLDIAKAAEIEHKIAGGGQEMPSMWDVEEQKARTANLYSQAAKNQQEAKTIAEAPYGMREKPQPKPAQTGRK